MIDIDKNTLIEDMMKDLNISREQAEEIYNSVVTSINAIHQEIDSIIKE